AREELCTDHRSGERGRPPPRAGRTPLRKGGERNAEALVHDGEVRRAARMMILRYGQDAAFRAALGADEMRAVDDAVGAALWRAVMEVIQELQRTTPAKGDSVH